jgi:hypothetical protein
MRGARFRLVAGGAVAALAVASVVGAIVALSSRDDRGPAENVPMARSQIDGYIELCGASEMDAGIDRGMPADGQGIDPGILAPTRTIDTEAANANSSSTPCAGALPTPSP